jgi:hypothetical protein
VLTAHERLTAREVVICPPRCRASARKSRCALWLSPRPTRSAFASPTPASTSAETRVRIARFVLPRRSNTHKIHLVPIEIP